MPEKKLKDDRAGGRAARGRPGPGGVNTNSADTGHPGSIAAAGNTSVQSGAVAGGTPGTVTAKGAAMPEGIVPEPESHPLEPFLPAGAKVLMLGSFPPKRERWSMDFYYPNFQNDMWRIMGHIFYGDKEKFILPGRKRFDRDALESFCADKGIALSDTAVEVIRHKDNASDKFLEITSPRDIPALLGAVPDCVAVVTTGQKATDTLRAVIDCPEPKVGESVGFDLAGRRLRFYRMPSSSRAYPMKIEDKAEFYRRMLMETGVLP